MICITRGVTTNLLSIPMFVFVIYVQYQFSLFPQLGYAVIPFVAGYDDIAGNVLQLDHIADLDLRPLDDLLRAHFLQGVLKNMNGAGEPTWDCEDAFGDGILDLSMSDV